MRFKNWHSYYETHQMISRLSRLIINGEDYDHKHHNRNMTSADTRYYFGLRNAIGDFDSLPIFDRFKPEGCGVSITAKRELPKAYLRGLLNIFKLCSYCAEREMEFDPDGLPF